MGLEVVWGIEDMGAHFLNFYITTFVSSSFNYLVDLCIYINEFFSKQLCTNTV